MRKSKVFTILLAAAISLAVFTAPVLAADVDASISIVIYDEDGVPWEVDYQDITIAEGTSLKDATDIFFDYAEPVWDLDIDKYNPPAIVQYLASLYGYATELDYYYPEYTDAEGIHYVYAGWDWEFTVDGSQPAYTGDPEHLYTADQYEIQDGDEIVWTYDYHVTRWVE
ncbi:MAG: DUF4430 domain-containing protein [Gracilibacteraceae bacterium]|jgi:opacity protein-like surface antigen|nr:DUF4430 domain-containing protein [Gracilibacteraceae bacterium]